MLPPMTDPAAADTMPLVTVIGGDDGIPPDPLLQSETYINGETNARVETAKPNKADVVVEKGKVVDLATSASVESESKMEVQMTELVAGTVTPMYKVNRSIEVNVARPSWLPEDWKFVTEVHIDGAFAGTIDRYYYDPFCGTKFQSKTEVLDFLGTGGKCKDDTGGDATPSETRSSKKQKKSSLEKGKEKITFSCLDAANPAECVCWVQTDSCADTWTPFIDGDMVPEGEREEWDAVFSAVSQRNANEEAGVSNVQ
ncbi:methyl-CpG-binding domain-containing protein 6-like [Capsicum galapagoense]